MGDVWICNHLLLAHNFPKAEVFCFTVCIYMRVSIPSATLAINICNMKYTGIAVICLLLLLAAFLRETCAVSFNRHFIQYLKASEF